MADENNNTATTTTSVTKREEEVKEAQAWLEVQKQFPTNEFEISRGEGDNKVSLRFGLVGYKRGVFKEKGCKYIGVVEQLTPENANKFIDFLTWERVKAAIENQLAITGQAATEYAVDEQDRYIHADYVKAIEEGSLRGETKEELLERKAIIDKASDAFLEKCKANPAYMSSNEGRAEMLQVLQDSAQIRKALDSRKRQPKS